MTGAPDDRPLRYSPMLASPWPAPFSHPDWSFEPKWDGVRVLVYVDGGTVALRSRTGRDVTATYPELAGVRLAGRAVLDGEIVAFDEGGRPSFERLQSRINVTGAARIARTAADVPVQGVVFDVLYADRELTALPWHERRRVLEGLDLPASLVRTDTYPEEGEALWAGIVTGGLEGMVAKRTASLYRPGERSPDWRKVANRHRLRAVVGGFTPGRGSRSGTFGALLLGVFDGPRLRYIGSVGTGFDHPTMVALRRALEELAAPAAPFRPDPALPAAATWVTPDLVVAVEHKGWTSAGRLRAASFQGVPDAEAATATWEAEGPGT